MPTEVYVVHPGVGQNRSSDGAAVRKVDGVNLAYVEQRFPDGVDRSSFFHGIVVPPDVAAVGNVSIRTIWRQLDPSAPAQIWVDVSTNNIAPPTDRDGSPLASVGPQAVPMPGTVGQEGFADWTIPVAGFAADEELLLGVGRLGTDLVNDTYGGIAGLVAVVIKFPIVGPSGGEWTDGGGWLYPTAGAAQKASVGSVANPPAGVQSLVETGHFQIGNGLWNGQHLVMGYAPNDFHFWISPTEGTFGVMRMKLGAPGSATDGEIVGTQS